MDTLNDLGFIKNIDVINHFVPLAGTTLLDAGCGGLTFTRQLAEQAEKVFAIDPDPIQAELIRQESDLGNIEFHESGADVMPIDSNSIDGVFFAYSLHHVPKEIYPQVFEEVVRILKKDGFLCVIEPIDCPFNQVMKLFHDEDQERADAQTAILELGVPRFEKFEQATYHGWTQYESFEDFAEKFGNRTFNPGYTKEDVRSSAVAEAFEKYGAPDYRFQSPKTVAFLSGVKT